MSDDIPTSASLRDSMRSLSTALEAERDSRRAQLAAAERERDEARAELASFNGILFKTNEALGRAGCHSALYYWEHIDNIAKERDEARALAEVRGREVARLTEERDAEREFAGRLVRVVEAACTWKEIADDPGAAVWPFTQALDAAIDDYVAWHKATRATKEQP